MCMSPLIAILSAIFLSSAKQLFLCLFSSLSHLTPHIFFVRHRSGERFQEQCDPQIEGKAFSYGVVSQWMRVAVLGV